MIGLNAHGAKQQAQKAQIPAYYAMAAVGSLSVRSSSFVRLRGPPAVTLGFHFIKHCFLERHEYLRQRLRLRLILTDFSLKLRVVVNERLHKNCSSHFVRRLHRRAPSLRLMGRIFSIVDKLCVEKSLKVQT
jgi:hypothetical protein